PHGAGGLPRSRGDRQGNALVCPRGVSAAQGAIVPSEGASPPSEASPRNRVRGRGPRPERDTEPAADGQRTPPRATPTRAVVDGSDELSELGAVEPNAPRSLQAGERAALGASHRVIEPSSRLAHLLAAEKRKARQRPRGRLAWAPSSWRTAIDRRRQRDYFYAWDDRAAAPLMSCPRCAEHLFDRRMTMSVRLVVTIQAKPGEGGELAQAYRARCSEVAKEAGCEQFEVFQGAVDPDKLVLLERWADKAALAAHAELNRTRPPLRPELRA